MVWETKETGVKNGMDESTKVKRQPRDDIATHFTVKRKENVEQKIGTKFNSLQ